MFDPTLPQGRNAHRRVRRSGRRKASRKDCLVAALGWPCPSSPGQSHKNRLVIVLSRLVLPRYRDTVCSRTAHALCLLGRCDAPWTALRIACTLIGGFGNELCEVVWSVDHPLQRASAVYLTASVVPQARRAIRRRRVVFRREVPSNTHRVASQPRTLVAFAGCTTGERAVCSFCDLASLICRPTQAAHHVSHLACVGGPSLTPWPGRNADDDRVLAGHTGPASR